MPLAPAHHGVEHMSQFFTFWRQLVRITHRALLIRNAHKDARFFESFQAIGEKISWNFFRRLDQSIESRPATQQIAHDQEGPFVPGDVEQIGDGTW